MKLKYLPLSLALAGIVSAGLSGCGGTNNTSTPTTITGTAATGAAFTGGTVYVYDSRGQEVGSTSTIDATTGQYSLTLADGAVAPFVLVARRFDTCVRYASMVLLSSSRYVSSASLIRRTQSSS